MPLSNSSRAMSNPMSPALGPPRKSALKNDDDPERSPLSGAVKAVQIAEPEAMSQSAVQSPEDGPARKQHTAGLARRLSGRLPASSPRPYLNAGGDVLNSTSSPIASPIQMPDEAGRHGSQQQQQVPHSHHGHSHNHRIDRAGQKLIAQVAEWLQSEKDKKAARKKKKRATGRRKSKSPPSGVDGDSTSTPSGLSLRPRAGSIDSQSSEVSLDRLQRIIDESMAALGLDPAALASGPHRPGRKHSGRFKKNRSSLQLARTASSDTDYVDGDVLVPSCEAVLDNSKTLSYSGGKPGSASEEPATPVVGGPAQSRREESKQAWLVFKSEIIRLAHTLRLKGWRRVPLDSGDQVGVERLSGALTNAVYVVSPPADAVAAAAAEGRKVPPKLLLRIYGPNVEQLIDREKELAVLQRLARKKIGPRLLGTFTNGRFEQYLNATALTPPSLREPETSRMIAKRMRELHDGIDLLEQELGDGPNVWVNWDNWLDTVERTVTFLDRKILSGDAPRTGFVCGVEWPVFRALVERYRAHLNEHYGHPRNIRQKLVFAHNDTQYGNILRIRPDDEKSPLLQPANEHKQLVVIDFEYAAANLPGLEFANHFTEWAYNYHDTAAPFACNTAMYPTMEQQRRFVRAYVDHQGGASSSRVNTPVAGPASTPPLAVGAMQHANASSSSIVDFMLDARVPPGGWKEEEKRREEAAEAQVRALLEETRLWRPANSAQWVAWGIVQAKVPDLAEEMAREREAEAQGEKEAHNRTAGVGTATVSVSGGEVSSAAEAAAANVAAAMAAHEEDSGEGDEFDYLAYTRDRALFFLGDCVLMGLVKLEDLPAGLREQLKFVDY